MREAELEVIITPKANGTSYCFLRVNRIQANGVSKYLIGTFFTEEEMRDMYEKIGKYIKEIS